VIVDSFAKFQTLKSVLSYYIVYLIAVILLSYPRDMSPIVILIC